METAEVVLLIISTVVCGVALFMLAFLWSRWKVVREGRNDGGFQFRCFDWLVGMSCSDVLNLLKNSHSVEFSSDMVVWESGCVGDVMKRVERDGMCYIRSGGVTIVIDKGSMGVLNGNTTNECEGNDDFYIGGE